MGSLLQTFGVTWGAFISQVIVVLIVYGVLKKFAFGPVLGVLEERRKRIAEGEANLEKIRADMDAAEAKVKALLDEANADADRLIAEAKESAESVRERKVQEAAKEAGQIIAKASEASRMEHDRLMAELKRDFGRLVVDATGKVTGKVLTSEDQARINEEAAGQIAL